MQFFTAVSIIVFPVPLIIIVQYRTVYKGILFLVIHAFNIPNATSSLDNDLTYNNTCYYMISTTGNDKQ